MSGFHNLEVGDGDEATPRLSVYQLQDDVYESLGAPLIDDAAGGGSGGGDAAPERAVSRSRQYSSASEAALRRAVSTGGEEAHRQFNATVIILALIVVSSGTLNRIAYKVMLVPLEKYPYLVSQVSSVLYTLLYFPLLWHASRRDHFPITAPLKRHWRLFALMGLLDGLGDVGGLVGARKLPGTLLTLLPKVIVPFTMIASYCILRMRYSWGEVLGACVVLGGVSIALIPVLQNESGDSGDSGASGASETISAIIYVASVAPSAVSFVIKELVFARDPDLTVFAVSFYGSLFELVVTLALLPLSAVPDFGHIPLSEMPQYFADGVKCWAGYEVPGSLCVGDPWAPMVYHSLNLSWNIALVLLLKHGGATLMFITSTLQFPLANLLFAFKWPLLAAEKAATGAYNILGLVVEVSGVAMFRWFMMRREKHVADSAHAEFRRKSVHARAAGAGAGSGTSGGSGGSRGGGAPQLSTHQEHGPLSGMALGDYGDDD